ncbi:type III secretion system YseE family protein [Pseudomonas sp. JAI115]|uniref:EscE/YscE/SsaE family type III secretion system needle protein co-chaperone n=1 Tax=Pseudomonas sp. JAI115 TaxID=2723061 RepID=UPI0016161164|nr:EscE/YscE/SsaE family type III secretion system needle protein co-chaperone [Pseudomonas sp. JAI115]MBB6155199.1 type III secretion system YseE family protein [Pseudomonas sp. JAI115]
MSRLTDLEDALHADTHGVRRDQWLHQLGQAQARLTRQLRVPQSPSSYQALEQCLAACQAGAETVNVLWQRYHVGAVAAPCAPAADEASARSLGAISAVLPRPLN